MCLFEQRRRGYSVIVIAVAIILGACNPGNGRNPRDKKLEAQRRKFEIVMQDIEREAGRLIRRGELAAQDIARSAKELRSDTQRSIDDLTRAADSLAQKARQLEQVPQVVQDKSATAIAAAEGAIDFIVDGAGGKTLPTPVTR
jgi:hypothetical protein